MLFKTSFIAACILLCLSVYSTDLQAQTADSENVKQLKQAQPLFDYSDTTKQATPEELDKRTTSSSFISSQAEAKKEEHSNIQLNNNGLFEEETIPSSRDHDLPLKKKPE